MKGRNFIIALIVCGILLSACESERERSPQAKTVVLPDGSIHLTPEQVDANGIKTAPVVEQELTATINAIGRVTARAGGESQVFSPFAGRLIADPARLPLVGSVVKKGDVIAEVEQIVTTAESAQIEAAAAQFAANAVQYQTAIEQSQQEVDLRQIDFDRAKRLYQTGLISLSQYQDAEFNLKQAQAKLAGAKRTNLEYESARQHQINAPRRVEIRAPLAGTVVAADLTAGQQIDPTKNLLTIADLSSLWVEAAVYEQYLQAVRRAARAEITTRANPERIYTGQLVTIGNLVDPANRTVNAIFAVSNSDGSLKLGMYAEARIPTGARAKALLVPASAVLTDEGQSFVYVETEPGVFRRRTVTIGARSGEKLAIRAGLGAGERVVTVGAQSLRSETFRGQLSTEPEAEKR